MQSDDDDTETLEELRSAAEKVTYSITLISPLNHNGDQPQKWTNTTRFSNVARLRSEIKSDFDILYIFFLSSETDLGVAFYVLVDGVASRKVLFSSFSSSD